MDDASATRANAIIAALADLAPSTEQRSAGMVVPTDWFRWLPLSATSLFANPWDPQQPPNEPHPYAEYAGLDSLQPEVAIDRRYAERLAAVDQLRPELTSIRVGWLFVAGRTERADGRRQRVLHPLVSAPVRIRRPRLGPGALVRAGDVEVSERVEDPATRDRLEATVQVGGGALDVATEVVDLRLLDNLHRLTSFARIAADAAGFPVSELVPANAAPETLLRRDDLVIVAGVASYAVHDTTGTSRAASLRAWATATHETWTAFHSLYLGPPADADEVPDGQTEHLRVTSPHLLTPAQERAVARSRDAPITLISGAPGTGKSHTIVAIACDALSRGESVLVAAKSEATVDALLDLLSRAPGPEPVVFGSSERRQTLASRLSGGLLVPLGPAEVATDRERLASALGRRNEAHRAIVERLRCEALLTPDRPDGDPRGPDAIDRARLVAPRLFDPTTDLDEVDALVAAADEPTGFMARRRARRTRRSLTRLAGADEHAAPSELAHAAELARLQRTARRLEEMSSDEIDAQWNDLLALEDELRRAHGDWLAADSRSRDRLTHRSLAAVGALATALRSGRAARRQQLARLDSQLIDALPLWVGSLPDIDDLLPQVFGLFDLVILDEASSIDQPLAAPALLRGRRGVVVGDPRQLRHVSFHSSARTAEVVEAQGLSADPMLAARLDVRRNSVFDVAASSAPSLTLDEHFRSRPHLVDLVLRRLYDGTVAVATRAPSTHSTRCMRVRRLPGDRDGDGVVAVEVAAAMDEAIALAADGVTSIGIVTPFRAQADALEAAALSRFSADQLESMGLRVGTVHAFQGNERDAVILSLGVGASSGAATWRFVQDPHLFAVMATRARLTMVVLVSADPPEGGLVEELLASAEHPPPTPVDGEPTTTWAADVARDLRATGTDVTTAYPSGRHVVDLAFDRADDIGVTCGVHPDGPNAHIERELSLRRQGWTLVDGHPARWRERRGELVVELATRFGAG